MKYLQVALLHKVLNGSVSLADPPNKPTSQGMGERTSTWIFLNFHSGFSTTDLIPLNRSSVFFSRCELPQTHLGTVLLRVLGLLYWHHGIYTYADPHTNMYFLVNNTYLNVTFSSQTTAKHRVFHYFSFHKVLITEHLIAVSGRWSAVSATAAQNAP